MYVKITNGSVDTYPYSVGQLRRDNPNTSFPKKIPNETLAAWGVYPVTVAADPDYDALTHKVELATSPALVDDVWTITKSAVALSAEEIQAASDAKANSVRSERNAKLSETDYLALSDNTLSAEMATYRQALRDITSQEGFPYNITWPTKPE